MEIRRASLALTLVGMAGAGIVAAAEGPQDKAPAQQPHGIYRGAHKAVRFDISPPLRSIPPSTVPMPGGEIQDDKPTGLESAIFGPQDVDPIVQSRIGPGTDIPG